MNHKAVCRTASATPGLLNTSKNKSAQVDSEQGESIVTVPCKQSIESLGAPSKDETNTKHQNRTEKEMSDLRQFVCIHNI